MNGSEFVGLTLKEAHKKIIELGLKSRIKSQDGVEYLSTMDYNPLRVNFVVVDNKVTSVTFG